MKQQPEPREVEESLRTEPEVNSSHYTPNVTPMVVSPLVPASSSSMDFDEFIENVLIPRMMMIALHARAASAGTVCYVLSGPILIHLLLKAPAASRRVPMLLMHA